MINTKCPDCTARFYVSEELVIGKLVRFRCRKCGGTITVDGTKSDGVTNVGASKVEPGEHPRLRALPAPKAPERELRSEDQAAAETARPPAGPRVPPPVKQNQDLDDDWGTVERKVDEAKGVAAEAAKKKPKPRIPPPAPGKAPAPTKNERPPKQPPATKAQVPGPEAKESAPRPDPLAARPVPVPVAGPKTGAVSLPAADDKAPAASSKLADGQEDSAVAEGAATRNERLSASTADPLLASKPRLSRVSMGLGSVFEMPADEEEVVAPKEASHGPAFEEDVDRATVSILPDSDESISLTPDALAPNHDDAPASPKPKPPPLHKIKGPPPPRATTRKDEEDPRESSARVDIMAAARLPILPTRRDDQAAELLAPVAIPADTLADLASGHASKAWSEPEESNNLRLASARGREDTTAHAAGRGREHAKRGMLMGFAAVGLLALVGIGYFATREGGEGGGSAATEAQPTTAPEETTTAPDKTVETAPAEDTAAVPPGPAPSKAGTSPTMPVNPAVARKAGATAPPVTPGAATAVVPTATAPATTAAPATTTAPATATAPATTAEPEPTTGTPPDAPPAPVGGAAFDKSAAAASIGALKGSAMACKTPDGPQGHARVAITFAPTGRVTVATVMGPPFAGTPTGGCVASVFRGASVPPFTGNNVTVRTSVPIF